MVEIDYSQIQQEPATKPTHWTPPRHVFFGGRNRETGEMLQEPAYVHQDYPKTLYSKRDGKVVAVIVKSEAEEKARGKDWTSVLGAGGLGVITCPSFDQITPEMHAATQAEIRRATEAGKK